MTWSYTIFFYPQLIFICETRSRTGALLRHNHTDVFIKEIMCSDPKTH